MISNLSQRAEEICKEMQKAWDMTREEQNHLTELLLPILRQTREEALEEARKLAYNHVSGGHRLCADNYHDDRWCSTCESMRDEAGVLEQQIKALASGSEEGK